MPFSRNVSLLVAAAFSCAAVLAALATHADDASATMRATFARPAFLKDAASPEADHIWRLGRTLFFDANLAASRSLACASCHQPDAQWSDHRAKAQGDGATPLRFRSPTLLDVAYQDRHGWEGTFASIADVAFFAMNSKLNMNSSLDLVLGRVAENPVYVAAFKDAFPDGAISKRNVGAALTRFVASITAGEAPFDRWIDGDESAIDASARRGFVLFTGRARCAACHSGWALTDGSFHDIGVAKGADRGRGTKFPSSAALQYAFKTPTLRNVAGRAPYMHDGSLATLEAVVDHYDKGGIERPSRDGDVHPLHLSATDKANLVAFLNTLSGPTVYVSPEVSRASE